MQWRPTVTYRQESWTGGGGRGGREGEGHTWEVDAVGIGATSRELRTPCSATLCLIAGQSQRSEGVTSHMSGCSTPLLTGLPS